MSERIPRLSIGMPVYNGQRYVAEALASLLGQTFSDFELVISDNGSTDDTENICRASAERDPRIRYVRHDHNRGAIWNFNHVFSLARGTYFCRFVIVAVWSPIGSSTLTKRPMSRATKLPCTIRPPFGSSWKAPPAG